MRKDILGHHTNQTFDFRNVNICLNVSNGGKREREREKERTGITMQMSKHFVNYIDFKAVMRIERIAEWGRDGKAAAFDWNLFSHKTSCLTV